MALFIDASLVGVEELVAQDGGILEVAATEGIELGTKIRLARDEVQVELETALARRGAGAPSGCRLDHIVVTPPLRLWLIFRTLALTYRDAEHSQLNARYSGRLGRYESMAAWASRQLFEQGLGLVTNPVPQPAAVRVTVIPGAMAAGTYHLCATWANAAGEEGSPSPQAALEMTSGQGLCVEIDPAPSLVQGWNLYVGKDLFALTLQNVTPIPDDQSWQVIELREGGRPAGQGQLATMFCRLTNILPRG